MRLKREYTMIEKVREIREKFVSSFFFINRNISLYWHSNFQFFLVKEKLKAS